MSFVTGSTAVTSPASRFTDDLSSPRSMRNVLPITTARKRRFAETILELCGSPVGFIDVGAGGPLKSPWTLLPTNRVTKIDFEPEDRSSGIAPLCASDHTGTARLFVARDKRASSLHQAAESFAARFDTDATIAIGELDVECVTLDVSLSGHQIAIDLIDVNAEGHDFRVIQGAQGILAGGAVSLIKIEVLFTQVWHGQGWFSDVDQFLRSAGYDLVMMQLESERPAVVRRIHHAGEVLWGKAFYTPTHEAWSARLTAARKTAGLEEMVLKAIVLYVVTETLGRATDLIAAAERVGVLRRTTPDDLRRLIQSVFRYAELEARAMEARRALNIRTLTGAVVRLMRNR
jgi:hypothetical protein